MKKRDIKYIIKRIIIGVGIVFCVGFLNKCSAKAQTLDTYVSTDYSTIYFTSDYNNNPLFDLKSPYSNNTYNYTNDFPLDDKSYIVLYNSNLNIYLYYFFRIYYNLYPVDVSDVKLYYDSEVGFYVYSYKCTDENDSQCDNGYLTIGGIQLSFILSNNSNLDYSSLTSRSLNKVDSLITNEYFYSSYGSTGINLADALLGNFEIYDTNLSSLYIDDTEIPLPDNNIGSNININANYNVNNCNNLIFDDNSCNLDKFFSTGLFINDTPYNINLYSDLTIYDNVYYSIFRLKNRYNKYIYAYLVFSPRQPDLNLIKVDIDIDDNTGQLSYKFYNELGQLNNDSFYVNSFVISDLDSSADSFLNTYNNTDLEYLKLSYSTDIFIHSDFNLHFFQSFDLYYSNLVFINVNNTPIEEFSRLRSQAVIQEGIDNGGGSWLNDQIDDNGNLKTNFLQNILNIVELPFKFLNDTITTSCSNLSLPIPFLNTNIELPCMKTLYHNVLGNFYEIIAIVINAFVLYRIAIGVTSTVKEIVDPTTDRIAVMDL